MSHQNPIDCLIVGGGPAGLTAAIYLRRFYRNIRLLDAGQSRAKLIPCTHNYPGFVEGISGPDLLARLRDQLARDGGQVESGEVQRLTRTEDGCYLATTSLGDIHTRTLLLATGVVDINPDLDGFAYLKQRGQIRYCPICDGFEHSDHQIGILGNGEHGVKEALFIKNYSGSLSLIVLQERADLSDDLRQTLRDRGVDLIEGAGKGLKPTENGRVNLELADGRCYCFDVLYCALGIEVRSTLALQLEADCDGQGCLRVDDHMETSLPGLYAAGDVTDRLDQLAVATGQAAIAATAIHNRLAS